jgi:K+-sensing histidine kinase KdpD
VKDYGVGISKKTTKNLFTAHMVSLSETRAENKGTGIGLLSIRGYLERSICEIGPKVSKTNAPLFILSINKPVDRMDSLNKPDLN